MKRITSGRAAECAEKSQGKAFPFLTPPSLRASGRPDLFGGIVE